MNDMHERWMNEAIELAKENVKTGGGPFGSVIVRNNELVARAGNRVTPDDDPTAHAEIVAIRRACEKLGSFQLSGCTLYSSCEPCPMCLGAIYWSRLDRVFYCGTREDAAEAGFDDAFIYNEISRDPAQRTIPMERCSKDKAASIFEAWAKYEERVEY